MRKRVQDLGKANSIGPEITEARERIGMKQRDLLAKLQTRGIDLNASALSKIEGGHRAVTVEEVGAISKSLNDLEFNKTLAEKLGLDNLATEKQALDGQYHFPISAGTNSTGMTPGIPVPGFNKF